MVPAATIGVAAGAGLAADGARPLQRQHVVVEPRPPPLPAAARRRRRGGRREQRAGEQHGEAEEREREEDALLPAPEPPRLHHPRTGVPSLRSSSPCVCVDRSTSLYTANPSQRLHFEMVGFE